MHYVVLPTLVATLIMLVPCLGQECAKEGHSCSVKPGGRPDCCAGLTCYMDEGYVCRADATRLQSMQGARFEQAKAYQCPLYDAVAQKSMSVSPRFGLGDMAGLWFVVATNEPTLPSFCTCTTLNFTMLNVDQQGRSWYRYTATTRCAGRPFSMTMKGWSNASSPEPGLFHENAALFNKTIPDLVPNMVIDYDGDVSGGREKKTQVARGRESLFPFLSFLRFVLSLLSPCRLVRALETDREILHTRPLRCARQAATTYACIGTPLHLFGLTKAVRDPRGYTTERIESEVAALNASTRGLLDMEKMRLAGEAAFRECGLL